MSFISSAKYFLTLSAILVLTSLGLMIVPGMKASIDFTGGTLVEFSVPDSTAVDAVKTSIDGFQTTEPLGNYSLTKTSSDTMILRSRNLSNEEHVALMQHLNDTVGETEEMQFTTIGPTVGQSLKERSMWALILASAAMVLYIAFAFRKVPRELSSWRFGIIAVVTLLHDVLITIGAFIIISQFTSFEFDTLFITALLTIIGYSVNDTIIIFDRIRDNLSNQLKRSNFADLAERSLHESITRSVNTSGSTLIMLSCLFFLGSESIRWFVLTLIIGTVVGTYSSIFLATPLLVFWRKAGK